MKPPLPAQPYRLIFMCVWVCFKHPHLLPLQLPPARPRIASCLFKTWEEDPAHFLQRSIIGGRPRRRPTTEPGTIRTNQQACQRGTITERRRGVDDVKEMEGRKRVLILVLARGLLCSDAGVYAMSMSWLHSKRRAIELAQTAIQSPNITHKHILLLLFPWGLTWREHIT